MQMKLARKSLAETSEAAKIVELANQAATQTRNIASGLCPVELEPKGLMNALCELAVDLTELFDVSCRFTCSDPVLVHDTSAAIQLYRIAQEAANNAIRHGKGKNVMIRLASRNGRIDLIVEDDGVGFTQATGQRRTMGLSIMRHRANAMGASLDITSAPEMGTTVHCSLQNPDHGGDKR